MKKSDTFSDRKNLYVYDVNILTFNKFIMMEKTDMDYTDHPDRAQNNPSPRKGKDTLFSIT